MTHRKFVTPGRIVTGYVSPESARVFQELATATRQAAPALIKRSKKQAS